jgi:hypothetical protein
MVMGIRVSATAKRYAQFKGDVMRNILRFYRIVDGAEFLDGVVTRAQ